MKIEILQINTALTSSAKAKDPHFMGSATNYGLNSTLKAVNSHGTDAPCPKKFVWLLKFKTGVNTELTLAWPSPCSLQRSDKLMRLLQQPPKFPNFLSVSLAQLEQLVGNTVLTRAVVFCLWCRIKIFLKHLSASLF